MSDLPVFNCTKWDMCEVLDLSLSILYGVVSKMIYKIQKTIENLFE